MMDSLFIQHLLIAIVIVAVSVVVGRLLRWLVDIVARQIIRKTKTTLDDRILQVIEAKITILTVLTGVSLGLREVRNALTPGDLTEHQIIDYLSIALFVFLVVVLAHLLSRLFKTTVEWYSEEVSIKTHTNIAPTIVPFTTKLVNIVIFFIVTMIILDYVGVNIGGLLVSLGVGSLAIALAAQETIANMIAWFVILVDQPVRIGDRIKLPTGEEGDVYQIGLRSTRILNYDNNLIIVPNSELVKSRIVNLSMPDLASTAIVDVNVAYGIDIDQARSIMLQLATSRADVQTEPPPRVFVTTFGEAAVRLMLVGRIPNVTKKFLIETELREQIYQRFQQAGIEIPSLPRLVQMKDSHAAQTPEKK